MKPVFVMHWIHENAFQLESTSTGTDVTDLKDAILVPLFVTLFPVHLSTVWLDRFYSKYICCLAIAFLN